MGVKAQPDNWTHRLFLASILAKASLGALQLATAAAIFFGITARLPSLAQRLVSAELAEDPNDFLAARIMSLAGVIPKSDLTFYTYYFSAHGALHVVVVTALLSGARWAYPTTILVLAAFVVYQIFEWMAVGGAMLLLLSAIDIAVIYLTLLEWARMQGR
jgi:uncharacterized membrane protein